MAVLYCTYISYLVVLNCAHSKFDNFHVRSKMAYMRV